MKTKSGEAVGYYTEYFSDALDSGRNEDDILESFGDVKKTGTDIRTEINIKNVFKNPGFKSFKKASGSVYKTLSAPFYILFFIFFEMAAWTLTVSFALLSIGVFIAGTASIIYFIYSSANIPVAFSGEILGAISMGMLTGCIFYLLSFIFYRLMNFSLVLSGKILRVFIRSSKKEITYTKKKKSRIIKAAIISLAVLLVISAASFYFSGLPEKLYRIFNSEVPENVVIEKIETDKTGKKLYIECKQTTINIKKENINNIRFRYEKSDWLEYTLTETDDLISFSEKGNGQLVLFSLVSLHENMTNLDIFIPSDFEFQEVQLINRGGHIKITGDIKNLYARTLNGNITLGDIKYTKNISIESKNGIIQNNNDNVSITEINAEQKDMQFESKNGDIIINK
jgi:uncharacterized membrane protein